MTTALALLLTAFVVAWVLLIFFLFVASIRRSRARRPGTAALGAPDAAAPFLMDASAQTAATQDAFNHSHHAPQTGADDSHSHYHSHTNSHSHDLGGHHSGMDSGHHTGGGFDGGGHH